MAKQAKQRCDWGPRGGELMVAYHDEEWGVPVHDDRKQFEFLTLESAQAGLSWFVVLRKREAYRRAFADFDPEKVARFTDKRIERLLADPGIIRNRLKVAGGSHQCPLLSGGAGRIRQLRPVHLALRRRPADSESPRANERLAGHIEGIRRAEQRPEAARLQICRQHDRVRPHAGRWHGQRPSRDVLSAQAVARRANRTM